MKIATLKEIQNNKKKIGYNNIQLMDNGNEFCLMTLMEKYCKVTTELLKAIIHVKSKDCCSSNFFFPPEVI